MSRNEQRIVELVEEAQGAYRDVYWLRERINLTLSGVRQLATKLDKRGFVEKLGDDLVWVR